MNSDLVLGADISMNHGAFVNLEEGELAGYQYVTDRQKVAKMSKEHGTYMFAHKLRDMHERGVVRLAFWSSYLAKRFALGPAVYVGVEDYAYGAAMNAHQIGEVGGLFRLKAWLRGHAIRFHDPKSVKMFAVHDGSADKREVAYFVQERWPETKEFARYSYVRGKTDYTVVEEDLCDAFAVAKLVWLEVQLRRGDVLMKDLHEKEVQVFNRVTKQWPVNILGRSWLQRGGE